MQPSEVFARLCDCSNSAHLNRSKLSDQQRQQCVDYLIGLDVLGDSIYYLQSANLRLRVTFEPCKRPSLAIDQHVDDSSVPRLVVPLHFLAIESW